MDQKIKQLEIEIEAIKQRNQKVEANKKWETSFVRKVAIAVLTYFVMCLVMSTIGVKDFYINAIIPTLGFVLSTFSLSFLKNIWENRSNKI